MRQENWLRGNTRTLRRQYPARNRTFVRVLPGIAGYCRVVGPGEKVEGHLSAEWGLTTKPASRTRSHLVAPGQTKKK
jgi:hypothetical protein